MRYWKILAFAAVACGTAAIAVGASLHFGSAARSSQVQPPSKATDAVAALGRVEPQSEIINLGPGASPERLVALLVGRGDLVKSGQVLGFLGGYAEQIAQRDVFRAQLEEATARLAAQTELDQARIESAEIKLRQAHEVEPLRIDAQEATVANLEAVLKNDKEILAAQLELSEKGATTVRLRDNQQTQVVRGQADLDIARARLAELKRQFELDIADAETQVRSARATLLRDKADIPIDSLRQQIALAEARAGKLTLVAPINGRILNVLVKPGEQVGTGAILTMGDTTTMRVVAEVYETDISRVRLDQRAIVTSRALQKPAGGRVVRIGNMIFKNDVLNVDPAARADARVVEVWIELDDATATENMTNLTVDVVINPSGPQVSESR